VWEIRQMATLNVEKLLGPVSDAAPCGQTLEYNPAYLELDRLAQGTPEQQVGTTIIPAVEPDWKAVRDRCVELLEQTRDLRLLTWLTLALFQLEGLSGLRNGLDLLKRSVEQFWDCMYPQLDPDDDNDPTERMNILRVFASRDTDRGDSTGVRMVRLAPLTNSRQAGRFGLRDIAIATGAMPPAPNVPKPEMGLIEAAAKDSSVEFLQAAADGARQSAILTKELEAAIDSRVKTGKGVDMSDFIKALNEAGERLEKFLGLHGISVAPSSDGGAASDGDGSMSGNSQGSGGASGAPITGEVQSVGDVLRLLDKICAFYARAEPSSPVPIILKRARRLVGKDFWEILNDLSPSAIETVRVISGPDEMPPAT
jgi:type VI secretion system protein ImpA